MLGPVPGFFPAQCVYKLSGHDQLGCHAVALAGWAHAHHDGSQHHDAHHVGGQQGHLQLGCALQWVYPHMCLVRRYYL